MRKMHIPRAMNLVRDESGRRIEKALIYLVNFAKQQMSRSDGVSAPGEYPFKQSGHLRRNLGYDIDRKGLTGRWGTNVDYGKFLQEGTEGQKRETEQPGIAGRISNSLSRSKGRSAFGRLELGLGSSGLLITPFRVALAAVGAATRTAIAIARLPGAIAGEGPTRKGGMEPRPWMTLTNNSPVVQAVLKKFLGGRL